MGRSLGLFAACAAYLVLLGGAVWLRAALAGEFARGERHGRMAAALEAQAAADAARADLEAARAIADRAALALDQEADDLKENVYELEKRAQSRADGRVCLDSGLVRALGAIGRGRDASGSP